VGKNTPKPVIYCAASTAGQITADRGSYFLWSAHWGQIGKHICGKTVCGYPDADGTQWSDHGGVWDESLINDYVFQTNPIPPPIPVLPPPTTPTTPTTKETDMLLVVATGPSAGSIQDGDQFLVWGNAQKYPVTLPSDSAALGSKLGAPLPLSCGFLANIPNMP
jgi:hypothetical protein